MNSNEEVVIDLMMQMNEELKEIVEVLQEVRDILHDNAEYI